jgi:hypothetical protein
MESLTTLTARGDGPYGFSLNPTSANPGSLPQPWISLIVADEYADEIVSESAEFPVIANELIPALAPKKPLRVNATFLLFLSLENDIFFPLYVSL